MKWHIITSEYPPEFGGVSDYADQVAHGLAYAGDDVHVWGPESRSREGELRNQNRALRMTSGEAVSVTVHREFGRFLRRDLRRVGKMLDQFPTPRRLLLQWVPHGFGLNAMNLPFCFWLWKRAQKGDEIQVMAHECYLPFKPSAIKQNGASIIQRLMTLVLLRAARRVWVSIPEWEKRWRPLTLGRDVPFFWLPVPSNVPVVEDSEAVARVRSYYRVNGEPLVGHFGTYDAYTSKVL